MHSELWFKSKELTLDSKLQAKTIKYFKPSGWKTLSWEHLKKTLNIWKYVGGKRKQTCWEQLSVYQKTLKEVKEFKGQHHPHAIQS